MSNDVAIFLDLDNLVIGAKQANINFDINLVLDKVREMTNGRVVLRRSYGDWRQDQKLLEQLTTAGFTTQSTVRINNFSKNLADMQIVVDTMDTLIDGHQYSTYVLMTGDRDFTPLVQSLRKRGKRVVGVGVKHTASRSFVGLCDEYLFYEDLLPTPGLTDDEVDGLLARALEDLLDDDTERVRASVLKQRMVELSKGAFSQTHFGNGSFSKFLARYPQLVIIEREDTTTYIRRLIVETETAVLHEQYRSGLKKLRFRIIPAADRLVILKDLIQTLDEEGQLRWRQVIDMMAQQYNADGKDISKNMINAVMLVARQGQIIRTLKGKSLATAPVLLMLEGPKRFQEAVVRCDATYLRQILELPEPFDLTEAALALYDSVKYTAYLEMVMKKWMGE
ncbi:MAG: NYN domain-containing protein [Candidatus Promineifilaceae bacterium]|nr:NYN domain-containing protein [Chloroflexota bacterium]MBK7176386.1 NYN domain-containing protein [Chloroflexota bacterium]MBP7590594.1 NYN domain-containing protein [Chloroflexota bacterium]